MRDSAEIRLIREARDVIIVGGGPVGSFAGALLATAGHNVRIIDKRPDPREVDSQSGRSINITMAERGLTALAAIGLREAVLEQCMPLRGRVIHEGAASAARYVSYGADGEAIYGIGRHTLTSMLVSAAEAAGAEYAFRTSCETVDLEEPAVRVRLPGGGHDEFASDLLIAADGAYSIVRNRMQRLRFFNYSQHYSHLEYAELVLPADRDSSWGKHRNAVHVWPRGEYMLIGFPNLDGSLTLSLQLPRVGRISHESMRTVEDLESLFRDEFPDVFEDVHPLLEDYFDSATGTMVTVRCAPWTINGRVLLLGDAAHAIFPSYGQGCNSSLEGCVRLLQIIRSSTNWSDALAAFERQRRPEADAIADLSIEHFDVLNRAVADEEHVIYEQISAALMAHDPERRSLYHNVSFTTMLYTEAQRQEGRHIETVRRVRQRMMVEGMDVQAAVEHTLRESRAPAMAGGEHDE